MEKSKIPKDFIKWLVDLRRWFHRYPEPSYKEIKTAGKICEILENLNVSFQAGIGKTGVVAMLDGKNPGPVVAFRADMDALLLEEANDVPYRSRHAGLMHACGHDGHMTIALGIIKRLVESGWKEKGSGRILFIFQPAEEGGAGAKAMLESGIFNDQPVEAVFAGHMYPELPAGHIGIAPSISNASADTINIRIEGKGGHGAHPHQCKDPIVAGAFLVTQLQPVISREVSPLESAVITIGRFRAGTASNIIPEEAVLSGTLRTLKPELRERIKKRLKDITEGIEKLFHVSINLEIREGYPVLINKPELVKHAVSCAEEILGTNCVHSQEPRMGAEDFSYFCNMWGGVMAGLGCHDPKKGMLHGLHSCHFDMDETVLEVGVRYFTGLLTRYLEKT